MPWTTKCTGTALLGLLASCGPVTPPIDAGVPEDAGLTGIDAGVTSDDAGVDAGASDAGAIDASVADAGPLDAGAVDAGRLTLTAFPRVGAAGDSVVTLAGPGLILGGGGADVDAAFVWMRSTIVTSPTGRAGDVVILRASGSNAYDSYIFGLAPFSSVQTLLLPSPSTPADLRLAASIVDKAEAVFFAGGDQARYTAWAGSELSASVQRVFQRGGVVGGTSAGLAVLGQYVYDARVGSVTSAEALANPFASTVTFTSTLFDFTPMRGVVTDSHFSPRSRFGRLTVFMARVLADNSLAGPLLGVGVDEATAVVVDRDGRATLLRQGASTGRAFFASSGAAVQLAAGQPFISSPITVVRLDTTGQFFDFARRCGTGTRFTLTVDARQADPFAGVDPSRATGTPGTCP